jgi:hypothetical protein
LHFSGPRTITGTMCISPGIKTCRIEDGLYPRRAFPLEVALPLRSLEVPDRRGSGGADRPLSNRPLAMKALMDCSKADLKVGEMHYRSHYAQCGSLPQETESWSIKK